MSGLSEILDTRPQYSTEHMVDMVIVEILRNKQLNEKVFDSKAEYLEHCATIKLCVNAVRKAFKEFK